MIGDLLHTPVHGRGAPRRGTWILVADGSRARLFAISATDTMVSALDYELIGSKLQTRQIAGDRPGRTFESGDTARHAKEPPTDPARNATVELAREISALLDGKRKSGDFERLIVVAPPRFLGDLRDTMPEALKRIVAAEVGKDLSKLPETELQARLRDVILA